MKLPIRLENAITKLYTAFHDNKLNAMQCNACAVGNICDNNHEWDYIPYFATTTYFKSNPESLNSEIKHGIKVISKTGYSVNELVEVESIFIKACEYNIGTKEQHFSGLCAVVEYLCELDNIPNVMDYTKLFETENDKPKYELQIV